MLPSVAGPGYSRFRFPLTMIGTMLSALLIKKRIDRAMTIRKSFLAAAIALVPFVAAAQQPAPTQTLPCDAFRKNQNGSWSSTRPVEIVVGGMHSALGPGVSFGSNAKFNGVDLYAALEQRCSH